MTDPTWPISIRRSGGNFGRFEWHDSDTRSHCGGPFWGDWWWRHLPQSPPTNHPTNDA
jgi:hypothetical protein